MNTNDTRKRAELEQARDHAIGKTQEECKLGGSRSIAIAQSNLAICYQMQIDNLDASWRHNYSNS